MAEGRCVNVGGTYTYEYHLKDHLGNVRASFDVFNDSVRIVEATHYYPFGLMIDSLNYHLSPGVDENMYAYNGKEWQNEGGFNQYDYGARMYDPAVGRWWVVDPLADQMRRHSPYNYAFNNPMRFIDPDGMAPVGDYYNTRGVKIGTDGKDDGKKYIVYRGSDVRNVKRNSQNVNNKSLKDAVLLPSANVVSKFDNLIERSNSPNTELPSESPFKGDDSRGGFHEEGGLITENALIESKSGPAANPAYGSATLELFDYADPTQLTGLSLDDIIATVHVHPAGEEPVPGGTLGTMRNFTQSTSRARNPGEGDDFTAMAAQKARGLLPAKAYGIVLGARSGVATFYDEKGTKFSISQATLKKIANE